ncbi:MAG: hypothetical protein ACREFQ_22550 [Stellaceae bacterium]
MIPAYRDRGLRWAEEGNLCSFGIGAAVGAALAGGIGAATGIAIPAAAATIGGDILVGAGGGALLSGITGGNPLSGALTGGLTAGVLGGVGDIASAAGLGSGATTALETAAGAGALGGAITGGSPLSGALTGGIGGFASGALSTPSAPTVGAAPATGSSGGVSAASLAGPAIGGEGAGPATDLATAATLNAAPASNAIGASVGPQTTTPLAGGSMTGSATPIPSINSATGTSMTPLDLAANSNLLPGAVGGSTLAAPTTGTAATFAGNQDFTGGTSPGGFSTMLDNAVSSLTKNPLALLGAGGLALDYFMTPDISQLPQAQSLETSAGNLAAQGNNLMGYMQSGTLPPGAAEAVNSATDAAKAQIRSNYANLGMSGSTMEDQALNMVDQNAAAQTFSIANQLMSEGANFTNMSNQLYTQILNDTLAQDTAFQQALASFSGGLAGMGMIGAMRSAA